MKVSDLMNALSLKVYAGEENLDRTVRDGYISDLLSDVLGNIEEGDVWITIQNHKNVVAVATLKDIAAVILAKGFEPNEEMLEFARQEQLPVLGSTRQVFQLGGELFQLLRK